MTMKEDELEEARYLKKRRDIFPLLRKAKYLSEKEPFGDKKALEKDDRRFRTMVRKTWVMLKPTWFVKKKKVRSHQK